MRGPLILTWILDTNCLENIILIAAVLIVQQQNSNSFLIVELLQSNVHIMIIFYNNYLLVSLFKINAPIIQMGPISGSTPLSLVKETEELQVLGLRGCTWSSRECMQCHHMLGRKIELPLFTLLKESSISTIISQLQFQISKLALSTFICYSSG